MPPPRGLVLVRAGRGHCFDSLMCIPPEYRTWDLAVSYYDDSTVPTAAAINWLHRYRGGKWDGIWQFFADYPDTLHQYDYYWLVDDDIETFSDTLDALFAYVREHRFQLAQPALTPDSYYSHRHTLACPGFFHRHTNVVEIMAPILSNHLLHRVLHQFQHTRSGFGLDWYWQRLVSDPRLEIAIIDHLPVRHGRPLRQHLRAAMQRDGLIPEEERYWMVARLGLSRLHGIVTQGVTDSGRQVRGRIPMAILMAIGYWRLRRRIDKQRWGIRQTMMLVFHQFSAPLGYKHSSSRESRHV